MTEKDLSPPPQNLAWLTLDEAAEYLRLPKRRTAEILRQFAIRRYAVHGEQSFRYRRKDIDRLLQSI